MHLCMHKHHELNNLGSTKKYKKKEIFCGKVLFQTPPPWEMAHVAILCDLAGKLSLLQKCVFFFVFGVSSFPTSWRVNEKACPHVQHTN